MQVIDIELKKVTYSRGDSPHPSMLIQIDEIWERFHDGVPVTLCQAEIDHIPQKYFDDGLLTIEDTMRTVVAK